MHSMRIDIHLIMAVVEGNRSLLRSRLRGLVMATCFLGSGLVRCAGAFGSPSMPVRQSGQPALDSSMALQVFITDILDAIKTGDTRRANELIASLILENDATWFVSQFTAETNSLLLAAYKQSTNDFVNTTRELYTADMQRGPIEVRVNRYDDVNHAPQPITEILRNMTVPEPLYEVSLSGNRPTFQIAVPSNGAHSRVIAGDLDGYFVETAQGFRFIPSNVLEVAVRELQKSRYEVLSRDTDGRATRIRIGAAALIGLLVDRVQS